MVDRKMPNRNRLNLGLYEVNEITEKARHTSLLWILVATALDACTWGTEPPFWRVLSFNGAMAIEPWKFHVGFVFLSVLSFNGATAIRPWKLHVALLDFFWRAFQEKHIHKTLSTDVVSVDVR